jgi:hypothetical protein
MPQSGPPGGLPAILGFLDTDGLKEILRRTITDAAKITEGDQIILSYYRRIQQAILHAMRGKLPQKSFEAEEAADKRDFQTALRKLLGPAAADKFSRLLDEQFRELLQNTPKSDDLSVQPPTEWPSAE